MKIVTNNVPRLMKYGYELPEKCRADYDYIDPEEYDMHGFFKYKGHYYDSGEFMRVDHSFGMEGWQGYAPDSAWSGVLIKFVNGDDDRIIVGRYYS